ncbi:hypothetical protein EMCRGX_G029617 [Ephydatia muelleri]
MARLYALTSLLFVVAVVFIINIWLVHHNLNCTCDCSAVDISPLDRQSRAAEDNAKRPLTKERLSTGEREGHHLAVVVPFRNRFEELLQFAPFLHSFLNRQHVRHQIWVVNQADNHRFNRAALINVGFLLSRNESDYMDGPLHITAPSLHPLYHYDAYVGGILIMTRQQFEKVDGLSNQFWGWGREDDELHMRLKEAGLKIQYPRNITTGTNTFKHIHDKFARPRDQKKYFNQWEVSKQRDRVTGLSTIQYKINSVVQLTIDGTPVNFVSVELQCDYERTPFCDNPV